MCRNIRPLFNYEPPATDEEIYASALQFVRKISGSTHPSKINEQLFFKAVINISGEVRALVDQMQTNAPSKDREVEREKARQKNVKRFGPRQGSA